MVTTTQELEIRTKSQPPPCWYCKKPVEAGIVTHYAIHREDGSGYDHKYSHSSDCTLRVMMDWEFDGSAVRLVIQPGKAEKSQ
jgi:hypothetical protein